MKITFKNKKLEKSFLDSKKLIKKYGSENSRKIAMVFSHLQAANSLKEIPPAIRPHPLKNNRQGQFSTDLKHPYRLIFIPDGEHDINDYSTVKEVIIVEITDTH